MQIWGHRGASGEAPENTLPAIELALRQGADGVEVDVQVSRDGRIVVLHDETVDRTTDGKGAVKGLPWSTLQRLDASGGDNRFAGSRIPLLADVLDLTRNAILNIELKNDRVAYPGLEEQILADVAAAGAADRVVLSSFNRRSLTHLRHLGVSSSVGLLYHRPRLRPGREAQRLGATAVHPPLHSTTARLVRRIHRRGLPVHVWTVNDDDDVRRMARFGVDAVITDHPARVRDALGKR